MTSDEFFDAQFPGTADKLRVLRAQDTEFDQICADYHEVFLELALVPQASGQTQTRYIVDLAESVSDLRNSIERRLQASNDMNE